MAAIAGRQVLTLMGARASPAPAPAPAPPLLPPLQHDVLLETATVREAVTTSAMLRLPAKMPRAAKLARVEAVLKQLVRPAVCA